MSRSSEARIEANRRNAKHSHGPTSAQGKHRSSQNAMRHGLTGRVVVLPHEDMEVFKAFSKEIVESLNADSPMERQCAQAIADAQWRLNRARSFEDGMIAMGHFEAEGNFTADSPEIHAALTAAKVFRDRSKDFVNLALYEQRIGKAQKEAFRQLYDLQDRRKAAMLAEPAPEPIKEIASTRAATMQFGRSTATDGQDLSPQKPGRSDTTSGHALSPQTLDCKRNVVVGGFVYSTTEIAAANPALPVGESVKTPSRTSEFTPQRKAA